MTETLRDATQVQPSEVMVGPGSVQWDIQHTISPSCTRVTVQAVAGYAVPGCVVSGLDLGLRP